MRFKKTTVAATSSVLVAGAATGVAYVREPSAPNLEFDASGCPTRLYERKEPWPQDAGRWGPSSWQEFIEPGAGHAVYCQAAPGSSLEPPLRLTQGLAELEKTLEGLPRRNPKDSWVLPGFPLVNLVLHYPDGRPTVMTFEFNRDAVATHHTVRFSAAEVTRVFTRLWRAEHTAADPRTVPPVECSPTLPDPGDGFLGHPAPDVVARLPHIPSEALPMPLAVVRACRYTADARGRLTLRFHTGTRTELESLREPLKKRDRRPAGRCVWPSRLKAVKAVDSLHLTDVTGRTSDRYIARAACDGASAYWLSTGRAVPPAIDALLSRLPS
ncbi:hypothetical protein [Actinocorallia populi]|uniref:hypothetical protein n=1 Tax=Actinocorallia populi TaxID=2079200 RepID=UPI000D08CC7B|nr:hypothetical protein [Actinocorallia populi]